ncbi:hypothetical protein JAAARDRAFT_35627 [Jaapia argillacea MUCL 33604]|uniref:Fe2OG dioxygenase domain-containing protein n=1 Tax=Jaapia argillacea MUCL 33604 TaxID=933084 RepID=A0A067Q0L8_9AGAM|nr:hypothetical protein JAAARDRAFT_35627 [Jaapia argillacea MUCL 33604]
MLIGQRRPRSPTPKAPSPDSSEHRQKRFKSTPLSQAIQALSAMSMPDPSVHFDPELLNPDHIQRLRTSYAAGKPFKHALVDKVFQDDLLNKVKDECLSDLNLSEKETDIYKLYQSGDLASLSFLTPTQSALLPSLLTVRDALFSTAFRNFLRSVTGCGPLSGIKQDMSVAVYKKGCHLLTHDDAVDSRRISFILYMPLPHYQLWKSEWGGALELYETVDEEGGAKEANPIPTKSISPKWNQLVFFEARPGHSFHSVEEVVVGEGEDGRQRLSISGWFHAPQPGEEGYEEPPRHARDSMTPSPFKCYPDLAYPDPIPPPLPSTPLSESHLAFLSEYLNPVYLLPRTMKTLASRFLAESSLQLHFFLGAPIASVLDRGLREIDKESGLGGEDRDYCIPPHEAGLKDESQWTIKGPPHRWRYCVLKSSDRHESVYPIAAQNDSHKILRALQNELFSSQAFRAWLACVTGLSPLRHAAEARRFRPGLDYTLVTSEERESRLDLVLGLTPDPLPAVPSGSSTQPGPSTRRLEETTGWSSTEWGGFECYMAPHDGEEDPSIYQSGRNRKACNEHPGQDAFDDMEIDDDNATLLTVQPGFNRLLLVLRDEGVMRFVKYVSAAAEGSRWDVAGEYEVGIVEEGDS